MLNITSQTVEALRIKIDQTVATLPGYPDVIAMNSVGLSLGPQLMAEIGSITPSTHGEVLTSFADVNSGKPNQKAYERQRTAYYIY